MRDDLLERAVAAGLEVLQEKGAKAPKVTPTPRTHLDFKGGQLRIRHEVRPLAEIVAGLVKSWERDHGTKIQSADLAAIERQAQSLQAQQEAYAQEFEHKIKQVLLAAQEHQGGLELTAAQVDRLKQRLVVEDRPLLSEAPSGLVQVGYVKAISQWTRRNPGKAMSREVASELLAGVVAKVEAQSGPLIQLRDPEGQKRGSTPEARAAVAERFQARLKKKEDALLDVLTRLRDGTPASPDGSKAAKPGRYPGLTWGVDKDGVLAVTSTGGKPLTAAVQRRIERARTEVKRVKQKRITRRKAYKDRPGAVAHPNISYAEMPDGFVDNPGHSPVTVIGPGLTGDKALEAVTTLRGEMESILADRPGNPDKPLELYVTHEDGSMTYIGRVVVRLNQTKERPGMPSRLDFGGGVANVVVELQGPPEPGKPKDTGKTFEPVIVPMRLRPDGSFVAESTVGADLVHNARSALRYGVLDKHPVQQVVRKGAAQDRSKDPAAERGRKTRTEIAGPAHSVRVQAPMEAHLVEQPDGSRLVALSPPGSTDPVGENPPGMSRTEANRIVRPDPGDGPDEVMSAAIQVTQRQVRAATEKIGKHETASPGDVVAQVPVYSHTVARGGAAAQHRVHIGDLEVVQGMRGLIARWPKGSREVIGGRRAGGEFRSRLTEAFAQEHFSKATRAIREAHSRYQMAVLKAADPAAGASTLAERYAEEVQRDASYLQNMENRLRQKIGVVASDPNLTQAEKVKAANTALKMERIYFQKHLAQTGWRLDRTAEMKALIEKGAPGAVWILDSGVRKHTEDCLRMGNRYWPWSVLTQINPANRHPGCFPAGVRVSGPKVEASTARWYEGELVSITFASGGHLAVTPNHPVLTPLGWVGAGELNEGDDLIHARLADGPVGARPDDQDVPALIEDVAESFGRASGGSSVTVPTSAEDFDGDGAGSDVHVVRTDGPLGQHSPEVREHGQEQPILFGLKGPVALAGDGTTAGNVVGQANPGSGGVSGGDLGGTVSVRHLLPHELCGCGTTARDNAALVESVGDNGAADPVAVRELLHRVARQVLVDDLFDGGFGDTRTGGDGSSAALLVDPVVMNAESLRNGPDALASAVGTDRVVEVRRSWFAGHVYNLETVEGWYTAEGYVVHNCGCRLISEAEAQTRGIAYVQGRQSPLMQSVAGQPYSDIEWPETMLVESAERDAARVAHIVGDAIEVPLPAGEGGNAWHSRKTGRFVKGPFGSSALSATEAVRPQETQELRDGIQRLQNTLFHPDSTADDVLKQVTAIELSALGRKGAMRKVEDASPGETAKQKRDRLAMKRERDDLLTALQNVKVAVVRGWDAGLSPMGSGQPIPAHRSTLVRDASEAEVVKRRAEATVGELGTLAGWGDARGLSWTVPPELGKRLLRHRAVKWPGGTPGAMTVTMQGPSATETRMWARDLEIEYPELHSMRSNSQGEPFPIEDSLGMTPMELQAVADRVLKKQKGLNAQEQQLTAYEGIVAKQLGDAGEVLVGQVMQRLEDLGIISPGSHFDLPGIGGRRSPLDWVFDGRGIEVKSVSARNLTPGVSPPDPGISARDERVKNEAAKEMGLDPVLVQIVVDLDNNQAHVFWMPGKISSRRIPKGMIDELFAGTLTPGQGADTRTGKAEPTTFVGTFELPYNPLKSENVGRLLSHDDAKKIVADTKMSARDTGPGPVEVKRQSRKAVPGVRREEQRREQAARDERAFKLWNYGRKLPDRDKPMSQKEIGNEIATSNIPVSQKEISRGIQRHFIVRAEQRMKKAKVSDADIQATLAVLRGTSKLADMQGVLDSALKKSKGNS